jgi:hypothetical protein
MEQLHFTTISDSYYPVQFTAIDEHTTCLVVADIKSNYATFLKVQRLEENSIDFYAMGISGKEDEP